MAVCPVAFGDNDSPQCLHLIASSSISSAQYGHFFITAPFVFAGDSIGSELFAGGSTATGISTNGSITKGLALGTFGLFTNARLVHVEL